MLKDEIRKGESVALEFKRDVPKERLKFLKTAVAFANGAGGRIIFGVDDDRSIVGMDSMSAFRIADGIVDAIVNRCCPLVSANTEVTSVDDKTVIVIDIQSGRRCPYFVRSLGKENGTFVRIGATTRLADDVTIRELEFAGVGRSFDEEVCPGLDITAKDIEKLCARMFRVARENCETAAERRAIRRVTAAQLEDWGVLTKVGRKLAPTYAYALLTGWRKFGGLVQCGVFRGITKATFVDRKEYAGSIIDQIDSVYEYLLSKINVGLEVVGTKGVDRYEIPPEALRELVINAVVHRSYVNPRAMSVQVALYDDRLEVITPGGIPHGMSVRLIEEGHSLARNRALALACKYMRIIESWGSGIIRVQNALRENGIPPLEIRDNGIDVVFSVRRNLNRGGMSSGRNVPISVPINVPTSVPINVPAGTPKNVPTNGSTDVHMKPSDRMLEIVRGNPGINRIALGKMLGVSVKTIGRYATALRGRVRFGGSLKTGGYFVVES